MYKIKSLHDVESCIALNIKVCAHYLYDLDQEEVCGLITDFVQEEQIVIMIFINGKPIKMSDYSVLKD